MCGPNTSCSGYGSAFDLFETDDYEVGGYVWVLMTYRSLVGLSAIVLSLTLIYILCIFPSQDKSGYYKVLVIFMMYLTGFGALFGAAMLAQVACYGAARSMGISDNKKMQDYETNPYKIYSQVFGRTRQLSVNMNVFLVFLITVIRLLYTLFPMKTMLNGCKTKVIHMFCIFAMLFLFTWKFLIKRVKDISKCEGLLLCEGKFENFCCSSYQSEKVPKLIFAFVSLGICFTTLILTLVLWVVASKKNREGMVILKDYQTSKNYKAVRTTLIITVAFLLANSAAMINNLIKVICFLFYLGTRATCQLDSLYFLADLIEQWLQPTIAIANPIIFTGTNRKLRQYVYEILWRRKQRRHSENQRRLSWNRRRSEDNIFSNSVTRSRADMQASLLHISPSVTEYVSASRTHSVSRWRSDTQDTHSVSRWRSDTQELIASTAL